MMRSSRALRPPDRLVSALYSPWETWAEIAAEHGRVRKDPPRLQVWVNTKLGESWEDQAGDTVPADPLMARREDWGAALPASVAVLTAGVDVQGDRIEVQVLGWGRDEESHQGSSGRPVLSRILSFRISMLTRRAPQCSLTLYQILSAKRCVSILVAESFSRRWERVISKSS